MLLALCILATSNAYFAHSMPDSQNCSALCLTNVKYVKSYAVPIPPTASVGQTIRVSSVDSDGKPTAWEAADLSGADTAVIDQKLGELSEQIGDLSCLTTTEKSNLVLAINESVQNSYNANTSASAAAESARVANECAQAMAGTFDFTGYLRYQIVDAAPETYDEGVLYIVTTA